jgi:hypothetical protein
MFIYASFINNLSTNLLTSMKPGRMISSLEVPCLPCFLKFYQYSSLECVCKTVVNCVSLHGHSSLCNLANVNAEIYILYRKTQWAELSFRPSDKKIVMMMIIITGREDLQLKLGSEL